MHCDMNDIFDEKMVEIATNESDLDSVKLQFKEFLETYFNIEEIDYNATSELLPIEKMDSLPHWHPYDCYPMHDYSSRWELADGSHFSIDITVEEKPDSGFSYEFLGLENPDIEDFIEFLEEGHDIILDYDEMYSA